MYVICPLSNIGSPEKRDGFLKYLSNIAPVTRETEKQCAAYSWFRSAEDNDVVPHHWLRGLEAYETVEANTVTHRASEPYKAFRAAVAEQKLLDKPSDLRFWRPTGVGFLTRPGTVALMKANAGSDSRYVVVNELTPRPGTKDQALGELQKLASLAANTASTVSFWVLDRGDEDEDEGLYVFSLFDTKMDAEVFEAGEAGRVWKLLEDNVCESRRRTTWVECGIGFIGRT